MTKKTLQSRYIDGLTARGFQELTATRYVGCKAFRHADKPTTIIFVGRGGSVRVGQNRTSSRAVSERFKATLLEPVKVPVEPVVKCPGCGITVFASSDNTSGRCTACERKARL